jgi:ArsR family transcriptional regulator
MSAPFSLTPPHVEATVTWEPIRTTLLSLSLLTNDAPRLRPEAWITQTSARLTREQRSRNRIAFERFGNALLLPLETQTHMDFPTYLNALATISPAALLKTDSGIQTSGDIEGETTRAAKNGSTLRAFLVSHLREMWDLFLRDAWEKLAQPLRGATRLLAQQHASLNGSAGDVLRELIKRDAPDWAFSQIGDARRIVFALSPHVELFVGRMGAPDTAYVFARLDNALLRNAPIQRAEVLTALSALADNARLQLIELLAANGEMRAQDLIAEMGTSQPNVSRHLKQLTAAGLIEERRAGDANKLYRLRPEATRVMFFKLSQLLSENNARANVSQHRANAARQSALAPYPPNVRPFLDEQGRIAHFSTKRAEQKLVLDYLITKFAPEKTYTEREATDLIAQWVKQQSRFDNKSKPARYGIDAVTLRRALIEENNLRRTKDGSKYWREM